MDGDGIVDHQDGCAYTPEQACTHSHDTACGYAAAVEEQPCAHIHDESCGYLPATEGTPCTFDVNGCPYCVVSWDWIDESDSIVASEDGWQMELPGVSDENLLTRQALSSILPTQITATAEDGSSLTLDLEWDLSAIAEAGVSSGAYTVSASLPDEYSLADGVAVPSILLSLGGAQVLGGVQPLDYPTDPLADITPEQSFIVVQKSITGLTDEQIDILKENLVITVTSTDASYSLSYGQQDGSTILWLSLIHI